MKRVKTGEESIQKPVKKTFGSKYNAARGYKVDRRKQKAKFDKDCLSETDMDEILAIG